MPVHTQEPRNTVNLPAVMARTVTQKQFDPDKSDSGFAEPRRGETGLNRSPRVQAGRDLRATIEDSPVVAAQRRQIASIFGSAAPVQLMTFTRFSGLFGRLKPYNKTELELLDSEKRTGELLDGLEGTEPIGNHSGEIKRLRDRFEAIKNGVLDEAHYETTLKSLTETFYAADGLSAKIAAQMVRQDQADAAEIQRLVSGSLSVVGSKSEAVHPNQVTAEQLAEVTSILNDIYFAHESNLIIAPDASQGTYNLARRSSELGLSIPPEIIAAESEILKIESRRDEIDNRIEQAYVRKRSAEKAISEPGTAEFERAKKEMADLNEEAKGPERHYDYLVKQMIKRETLKDLVKIAQTGVGRDLLRTIAKTSLESSAKRVTINAYGKYKSPTAAKSKGTDKPYVDYAPQYFKDRDLEQRQEGGAIRTLEGLKAANAWQENARTDITLFHELVHTHHFQSGASDKNDLVSAEDAVDAVDAPYTTGNEDRGVREEEYATVGLGKYARDEFTENAYRRERRDLGEDVSERDTFTHKDRFGNRVVT